MDKFETVIEMTNALIAEYDTVKSIWHSQVEEDKAKKKAYNTHFDELLGYCRDNFPTATKDDEKDSKYYLREKGPHQDFTLENLRAMAEQLVVVAVGRYTLAELNIQFDPNGMPNFRWFSDNYKTLIIDVV